MNIYINHLKLSGIKSIKTPIELSFYNKTITLPINLENTNIKAIYGANGIGKSAIIHGLDIYKSVILKEGYLYTEEAKDSLSELINKQTKTFNIEISFFIFNNEQNSLEKYKHELIIKESDNNFYIKEEKLIKVLTRNEKPLISILNGKITTWSFSLDFKEHFINKLEKRSIVEVYKEIKLKEKDTLDKDLEVFHLLARNIFVSTESTYKDYLYFYSEDYNSINKPKKFNYKVDNNYTYVIDLKNKGLSKRHFKQMEQFIKVFKKEIINIDLDFKIDKDKVYIDPYFVYEGYKVHLKFESSGIKKLADLFMFFKAKEAGGIIFIDELDASINDVYLIKLLEYFKESNSGQLVFTTHNISPMEVLSDSKHSLDFITEKGQITSWKKSGNYKAANVYQSGLIKGLPFNVYPFDFVGVFEEED